jgi:hypothetical protein
VEDLSRLDFSALSGMEDECEEILKQNPLVDEGRRGALCSALKRREGLLQGLAGKSRPARGGGPGP